MNNKILGIIFILVGLILTIFLGIIVISVLQYASQPQYQIRWDRFIYFLILWMLGIVLLVLGIILLIKHMRGQKTDKFGVTKAEKMKKVKEKWG